MTPESRFPDVEQGRRHLSIVKDLLMNPIEQYHPGGLSYREYNQRRRKLEDELVRKMGSHLPPARVGPRSVEAVDQVMAAGASDTADAAGA